MKIQRDCEKQLINKSGIYKLTNKYNGKVYIGSTVNFRLRWNQHSHFLSQNKHGNQYLQKAYNKYNCDWKFSIIEIVEDVTLLEIREKFWIEYYIDNKILLFNLRESSNGRFLHSAETKLKISSKKIGYNKGIKPKNYEALRENWKRPILEFENNILVREFDSIKSAAEFNKVDKRYIFNILKGISKNPRKIKNKFWKYKFEKK